MPFQPGATLGPYQILGLLGAGGMGDVYRAHDPRLGRDVAIKVLPDSLMRDEGRLARFRREARLLASLEHPGIAIVHEFEVVHDVAFLVMELVPGETLEERLSRGALSITEALPLFHDIADAVEAAHARGVVHRDLKPANIKITPAGKVKILDFGLAKALGENVPSTDLSALATRTRETQVGTVVGTAPYMSPEQARGKPVDARTDIWAFGCLLYEALAGTAAFRGETVSDTVARVLEREPSWERIPRSMPAGVETLLRRCLEKSPEARPSRIGDVRHELERIETASTSVRSRRSGMAVVALIVSVLIAVLWTRPWRELQSPATPRFVRPVQLTSAIGVEDYPSWSPDGKMLAYGVTQSGFLGGNSDIWVLQVGSGVAANRTADHPGQDSFPSWSPDGSQIAFWSDRDGRGCYVMPAIGGRARKVIAANPFQVANPQWSPDGSELACASRDASESPVVEIVGLETGASRRLPLPALRHSRYDLSWSPEGRFLAYVDADHSTSTTTQLWILDVADGDTFPITEGRTNVWDPSWAQDTTAIYFVSDRAGTTMDFWRQRLDDDGAPIGEPEALTAGLVARHVRWSPDGRRVAYSKGRRIGNLWRIPVLTDRLATWSDAEQVTFDQALIEAVDLAADGRRALVSSDRGGNPDIWNLDLDRGEWSRITTDGADDFGARWSPNESEIAFYSTRSGNRDVWVKSLEGGPARAVTTHPASDFFPVWSPDGARLAFHSSRPVQPEPSPQVFIVPAAGGDARPVAKEFDLVQAYGEWTPDGTQVAFVSESSPEDATWTYWMVPAEGGTPERLTSGPASYGRFSADGERFFFIRIEESAGNLWTHSLANRSEHPITDLSGRRGTLQPFSLATHDDLVYFTWEEELGDLWVMDAVYDSTE